MAERSKAPDSRSGPPKEGVGSNPTSDNNLFCDFSRKFNDHIHLKFTFDGLQKMEWFGGVVVITSA